METSIRTGSTKSANARWRSNARNLDEDPFTGAIRAYCLEKAKCAEDDRFHQGRTGNLRQRREPASLHGLLRTPKT